MAGVENLRSTAVLSVRPRLAPKKTAPFRPSSRRMERLTILADMVVRSASILDLLLRHQELSISNETQDQLHWGQVTI